LGYFAPTDDPVPQAVRTGGLASPAAKIVVDGKKKVDVGDIGDRRLYAFAAASLELATPMVSFRGPWVDTWSEGVSKILRVTHWCPPLGRSARNCSNRDAVASTPGGHQPIFA